LIIAACRDSTRVAGLLITQGADLETKNGQGNTALSVAAHNNHAGAARLLIEHGANTDGIDLSWMDDHEDA